MLSEQQVKRLHELIAQHEDEPRFKGRRSLDKSCGEVIEITHHECVPADGYPVVDRINQPNFEGERAAALVAKVMSRTWLVARIEEVFREGV